MLLNHVIQSIIEFLRLVHSGTFELMFAAERRHGSGLGIGTSHAVPRIANALRSPRAKPLEAGSTEG
jgi:hypothetical protein